MPTPETLERFIGRIESNAHAEALEEFYTADGYIQAGFLPVRVSPMLIRPVFLMLLPRNARFNFAQGQWDILKDTHPDYVELFQQGATRPIDAQARYEDRLFLL